MIEIEINGEKFMAEDGSTVIEAADCAGIHIPRFCYHKKLSVAANCRMCLVEVENSRKPLPACATPVTPGMKIFTKSESATAAQKSIMEYLLVNHPLDCPICDQGGECELQDLSMGYGVGKSCSDQPKRSIAADDIGPLIDTSGMTRCIYCTRCVRFGEEVAGLRELGVCKRGEDSEVGTYIPHLMHSEISANVIDLCPVGALTSKPFRFQARSWELVEKPSIAAHDCWGSNIYCHVRNRSEAEQPQLMRVVPRENDTINENWLSDRDRFAYQALVHKDRLLHPEAKRANSWQKVNWQTALPDMFDRLQQVIQKYSAEQVCVIASPNISTESAYAISQLMAALGVKNTDYRIHRLDFSDKTSRADLYGLTKPIDYIETCDRILLIGANVRHEQPLAALRMRKAAQEGAKIYSINSYKHNFNFPMHVHLQHPQQWLCSIALMINSLLKSGVSLPAGAEYAQQFVDLGIDDDAAEIVQELLSGRQKIIWLGAGIYRHPSSVTLVGLARILATMLNCELAIMKDGANVGGMHLAGLTPHTNLGGNLMEQPGEDMRSCLENPRKAYIFFGLDPELDLAESSLAKQAVIQAELVVAFNAFSSNFLREHAHYLLPITTTAEEGGSMINITGQKQSYMRAVEPVGEAKPIWKIMHQLSCLAEFDTLDDLQSIEAIDDVLDHVYKASLGMALENPDIDINNVEIDPVCELFWRVGPWELYTVNSEVRRADALQQVHAKLTSADAVIMHSKTAAKISSNKVKITYEGEPKVFDIIIDDKLAPGCLLLPSGTEQVQGWGVAEGCVQVEGAQDA